MRGGGAGPSADDAAAASHYAVATVRCPLSSGCFTDSDRSCRGPSRAGWRSRDCSRGGVLRGPAARATPTAGELELLDLRVRSMHPSDRPSSESHSGMKQWREPSDAPPG